MAIEGGGGEIADGARRLRQRLHGQEHPAHVRMLDDGAHSGAGAPRRAALAALVGIRQRLLIGALRDGDALEADGEARVVHHREHAGETTVLLADEPARGAAAVAEDHRAGGRGMDAELVLDAVAADVVARPVRQHLRNEKERDAARAGRRVGKSGEDEMDDVVREVVLAVGDEDLLPRDPVAAVAGPLGAGADRRQVGARLRLGEVHGGGPFARHHLLQIAALQRLGAVRGERLDAAHGEERPEPEGEAGGVPHLDAAGIEQHRQALPAVVFRPRQARSSRPPSRPCRPP